MRSAPIYKPLGTILVSSLGSVVMWLLLVPYFDSLVSSSALVGLLGMERQVLGVLGAIVVGVWVDQGRVTTKFAILQGAQVVLALALLGALLVGGDANPDLVLVWTALRFGLVGACAVLSFRLLADVAGSSARGAIYHMVTSPQGAMVFASVICVLIPAWTGQPFHVALVIDCATSTALTGYLLWSARREDYTTGTLGFDLRSLGQSVTAAVGSYWLRRLWPWNLLQLWFLASLSGMMVYAYAIAERQTYLPTTVAFAAAWFFYGLAFWVTAPLVRGERATNLWALAFAVLLVVCGAAAGWAGNTHMAVHIGAYVVLTFVNAYWIHFTNVRIVEHAPETALGRVRSSMVFYLGLIFGVGEQLVGLVLDTAAGLTVQGLARAVGGVVLAGAVLALLRRNQTTPGPQPETEPAPAAAARE